MIPSIHICGICNSRIRYLHEWLAEAKISWKRWVWSADLDEGEPRLLNGLERPIEDGQKGSCSGESTTFEFVVEHANLEVEFIDETKYPRVTAVPLQISTKVEDDWLTNTEKWDSYFRGENSWKRNRVTGDFIRCKPNITVVGGVRSSRSWVYSSMPGQSSRSLGRTYYTICIICRSCRDCL